MKRIPAVKTVMTPFPYSVDMSATVAEAREFMREHRIRHLPVTNSGELVGLITDRDIKLLLGPDFAYPAAENLKVGEAMIAGAYTVDLNDRVDNVLCHMADHQLGSALVTREGRLAGVFTVTDVCRAFADYLREEFRHAGGSTAA